VCAAARALPAGNDDAARAMFEEEMKPYAAAGKAGVDGKLTSYCVQSLRGARTRHGAYTVPLYKRPPELVSIDLTPFLPDARGKTIWGRLETDRGRVVPFATSGEIRRGALTGRALELLWVDDPVDALYAQIEGSGRVRLEDGSELWIEVAGKNGRAYRGVGKLLRDLGELPPGGGTMQGIRAWFNAHPDRRDEIMDQNASVVFFKISSQPGAQGSQGVTLTARRSLAIDRAYVAWSTPIWVDTKAPQPHGGPEQPWRHLVIAQDTGGGILGPVRGDIYMGDDEEASEIAGRMGGPGRYWLLLPRSVRP
jgi:membrane-bound lytic murein transglycosylase A